MSATISQTITRRLPLKSVALPPTLKPGKGNLYEVLSRTPTGGVGTEVYQTRWSAKNILGCYWLVTRSVFKDEGKHGRAWGRLYWKGVCVSPREERIRGALKYTWREGRSGSSLLGSTQSSSPEPSQN
uniref:Uncharacterized protein n=1 Tax=Psilocybe cubensis TaxID=181762 RepID=A0A8H8CJQ7_PSICU